MAGSTHRLQGNFSLAIGREFPVIPGLQTMVFFGTGGDANEGNRVAGGPALAVISGAPVHGANFVSCGWQPVGNPVRADVIDTQNFRDASWVTSGWTAMTCARSAGQVGNYVQCLTDQNSSTASPGQAGSVSGIGLQGGNNRVILFGQSIANRGNIQLSTPISNWHIVGFTQPAGGLSGSNVIGYEFTENQAGQSLSYTLTTNVTGIPVPPMSLHLGWHPTENTVAQGPCDYSWLMIAKGVLTMPAMAAIAASARVWLARRLIVC